jgi:Glycosyltransferase family 28 N-terminal domain
MPAIDDGRVGLDLRHGLSRLPDGLRAQLTGDSIQPDHHKLLQPIDRAPPALNIVMQVVGSQGDVQPFVALGMALKRRGHRVRVATHPQFQQFVESYGLEFFSIGGDPAELMAYMVKNPGLIPKIVSIHEGELHKRRRTMRHIMHACWRSCYEPADESTAIDIHSGDPKPFVADAIIANPPSFAHIHCAEKLGIPLHMVFTMPWSPTREFPHPLANINASEADAKVANFLSFFLIDTLIWQGLGDIVDRFRKKVLDLEPIDPTQAPGFMSRQKIPHTYCWLVQLFSQCLKYLLRHSAGLLPLLLSQGIGLRSPRSQGTSFFRRLILTAHKQRYWSSSNPAVHQYTSALAQSSWTTPPP